MKSLSNIIKIGVMAIAPLATISCSDFLDEQPKTSITEELMYSDPSYAESNLQSCYKGWREMFKDRYIWELMVGTDEIQSGAYQALKEDGMRRGSLDRYDALLNSEIGYVADQWNGRWKYVGETAKIIKALRAYPDDEMAASLYGEACFIRAGLTMELTMVFGRIPILDLDRIAELGYGRQPLTDVWSFILNDFKEAVRTLPETNDPGRATLDAGRMLYAYALMAAPEETGLRDFAKAAEQLAPVVKSGNHSLVDYYDLWDYNMTNTSESIFEWQFQPVWPDNNAIQFQIGSRAVQSYFGDGCFMSGYDHAVPTKWAYSDVEDNGIWEEGDVRKEEAIRYDFEYYGTMPTYKNISWEDLGDDHDELKPHIKKYEDFRTDSHSGLGFNNEWYSGKNIPFLRLGNAILLYAECLNETGHTSEAVDEVNKIRRRAWENALPADKAWKSNMSKEDFRRELMTERVRELFGERWRKFDLVRTGNFVELVSARNEWAKRSGTIAEYNSVWPIPLAEMDQNDDIDYTDQNEGYR